MRNITRSGARQPVSGARGYRAGDVTRSNAARTSTASRAGSASRGGSSSPY